MQGAELASDFIRCRPIANFQETFEDKEQNHLGVVLLSPDGCRLQLRNSKILLRWSSGSAEEETDGSAATIGTGIDYSRKADGILGTRTLCGKAVQRMSQS